jgi:alpha-glucosidase (family GH31 glycosyl hydrolase)
LGETILVAPIIEEGATSRDIVLPSGSWKDGNDGKVYEGPQILKAYPAPIDVLPFFIKQ